jgi:hypothetical protein
LCHEYCGEGEKMAVYGRLGNWGTATPTPAIPGQTQNIFLIGWTWYYGDKRHSLCSGFGLAASGLDG